jgi:outer membrane protein assembly complex protein YaeT
VTLSVSLLATMGLFQVGEGDVAEGPVETADRLISRIEFEGAVNLSPVYLQSVAQINVNDVWDDEAIAAACARLAGTGKFAVDPYAQPREEEGGLVLVFVVSELPFVTGVDFVGNEKFKTSELLKEIELSVGSAISEFLIRQAQEQIARKYREAGYYYVSVETDGDVLRDERRVLFRISEGPRVKVRSIVFDGAKAYPALELRSKIETNTYFWLFRTGAFDDETAERDAAMLRRFYVDRGYLNAQVGYRIELADNQSDLTLIFQIDDGLRHEIQNIRLVGNTVFDDSRLLSEMQSALGLPIDADVLKRDRERLVELYGRDGYIYADVATTYVFAEQDGFVDLTVQVNEGQQYRMGKIVIRGNRHTKDKVIRRELRFFPEELYDTSKVKVAERRLVETRLFSEATITPQGDQASVRDVLVDVAEAETTTILFGVGVTSNSGVVGSISVEQRNFDLFDFPRTTSELFSGRAFRGAGQTMRLQIEPGTELSRAQVEFREPYLLDHDLGLGVGAYVFERGRDEWDEQRIGFYTSLDRRFREGPLEGWASEIAARFENVKIDDLEPFTAEDIEDAEGNNFMTSLKGSLLRDRTDSLWLPSEGDRLKVSWEQFGVLGGDWSFSKAIGEYDYYITMHRDTFDRKHIVHLGAKMGQLFGDAPVFERFYGGGIGSIRGFEFRGISPRDGFRDDAVGGDFMLETSAEYSFPVVGETIRGVTFLDMGTVEENFGITDWRASIGVGARIYIKYFGPIPLAFDLALPFSSNSDDDEQVFNFSFGTTF